MDKEIMADTKKAYFYSECRNLSVGQSKNISLNNKLESLKTTFCINNKNEKHMILKPNLKRSMNYATFIDMKNTKCNHQYYLNNNYRNSQLALKKIKLDTHSVGVNVCSENGGIASSKISPVEVSSVESRKQLDLGNSLSNRNSGNYFTGTVPSKNMGSYVNRTYTKVNGTNDTKHRYLYIANNSKYGGSSTEKSGSKLDNQRGKIELLSSKVIINCKELAKKCEAVGEIKEPNTITMGSSKTQAPDDALTENIVLTKELISVKTDHFAKYNKEVQLDNNLDNTRKVNTCIGTKYPLESARYVFKNNRKLVRQKQSITESDTTMKKGIKYIFKNNRKLVRHVKNNSTRDQPKNISSETLRKLNAAMCVTKDEEDGLLVTQNTHKLSNMTSSTKQQTSSITSKPLIVVSKTKVIRKYPKHNTNIRNRCETAQHLTSSNKVTRKNSHNPLISLTNTKMVRKCQLKSNGAIKKHKDPFCSGKSVSNGSFVSVGSKKLIRIHRKCTSLMSVHKIKYKLKQPGGKVSPKVMMAKFVTSKYKYVRQRSLQNGSAQPICLRNSKSKYKIDRRSSSSVNRVKKRPVKFLHGGNLKKETIELKGRNTKYYPGLANRVWLSATSSAKYLKPVDLLKKKSISGRCQQKHINLSILRTLKMRNIGGVLYKCTPVKLMRKSSDGKVQQSASAVKVKSRKVEIQHVIYIRGTKFIMDSTGSTLKRSKDDVKVKEHHKRSNNISLKRVDIGGVTYVQKSQNILIRTNTHRARRILSQAKQRSIAVLTRKKRKNNQLCLLYHRLGKCHKMEAGTCERVHDPKYIAVCRKFLEGHCNIEKCLLSHNLGPEKMPTCKYFLEAICARQNCPYLHVRVNPDAEICRNFLQGYCSSGKKCKKRHLFLCPEFEKNGNCPKGKFCPFPHSREKYKFADDKKLGLDEEKNTVDTLRYYGGDKKTYLCEKSVELRDKTTNGDSNHEQDDNDMNVQNNLEQDDNDMNIQNREQFFALDFIPI